MTPVIRVSDDVFRRLQLVSEPLVDTPSQVLDRLLTHFEESQIAGSDGEASRRLPGERSVHVAPVAEDSDARLFIAPASEANLDRSIRRPVSIALAASVLTSAQLAQLHTATAHASAFYCWALTDSRRAVFDAMRVRDVVILIAPGAAFTGRVQHKLISEALGQRVWASQPRLPWKFIYLLTDLREQRLRKDRLNQAFGYKRSHVFPGVSRVRSEALRRALDKHGSIDQLIGACS